jgi:DNA-binding Lrp family transcriptional regulator
MVEEEIITICAIPNPVLLGYSSSAFVILDIQFDKMSTISQQLRNIPEIVYIAALINNHEMILGIQAHDNQLLFSLINERIAQIEGIQKTETFVAAGPKKFYYGWRLSEFEQ